MKADDPAMWIAIVFGVPVLLVAVGLVWVTAYEILAWLLGTII